MKGTHIIRISLAFGGLICLAVLTLSYLHSVELFERSGYHGIFAHVGVIGFELMFVLGSIIMIWSRWVGAKISGASKYVFYLGVGVNVYSNIASGFAKGEALVFYLFDNGLAINEPVLIGALIPMMFVGAELVIADAIFKYQTHKQSSNPVKQTTKKSNTSVKQKSNKHKQSSQTVASSSQTKSNNPVEHQTNDIKQTASKIKQEEGQFPTLRRLADMVGTTPYQAKKAIDELKQKIS